MSSLQQMAHRLRPVEAGDLEVLTSYYRPLVSPLADLNALMMVAWSEVLRLRLVIDEQVLYVLADWEGRTVLWGPPLGPVLGEDHLERGLDLAQSSDPTGQEPAILYLWDGYPAWSTIRRSARYQVTEQASEYWYRSSDLAALRGRRFKKKRHLANRYARRHRPIIEPYEGHHAPACLDLLYRWAALRGATVQECDRQKLELERQVCERALRLRLPLLGVVVLVEGILEGFSVGYPHGTACFNCMFEKTNLLNPGVGAFVFQALAQWCAGRYPEINAGEDWGVQYLAECKQHWKPDRRQSSYTLSRQREVESGSDRSRPCFQAVSG
jgi:hypothetical protein